MNKKLIIFLLLLFIGVASLLAVIAIIIVDLELIYEDYIVNMLFSIIIIPIYLAVATHSALTKIRIPVKKRLIILLALIALLNAINLVFDVYDDFWYAIIGNDHISKLIMLTIIILATIVYFLGILLLKAVTSSK